MDNNINNEFNNPKIEREENFDISEAVKENKKSKKTKAPKKAKLLKNQAFLKRGRFSIIITAAVIIAIIMLNSIVDALANRFVLEFDMSTENTYSIAQENIDYIKSIDDEIEIILCADKDSYIGGTMEYYAQAYGIIDSLGTTPDYYKQTIKLIEKYDDYNSKIKVSFLDTQTSEFAAVAEEYSSTTLNYGDILVSSTINGTRRFKKVGYTDIYQRTQNDTYASMGYTDVYDVTGNKIETALTGAISYVVSTEDKNIAILTGHSTTADYTSVYIQLLKDNNYNVDIIANSVVTEIDDKYDAVAIIAPSKDFLTDEIIALSDFLENDGKLEKGLLYFADATVPYLPNFAEFLLEWGIQIDEGILFEPNEAGHIPGENTRLYSYSSGQDDITADVYRCISGYNVPIYSVADEDSSYTVTSLVETSDSVVAAPLGTPEGWTGFNEYTAKNYSTIIQSEKFAYYGDDNEDVRSYVMAFSSVEFIYSDYAEAESISNKDISFTLTERAARSDNTGISFVTKSITNESFVTNEAAASAIRTIFVIIIPLVMIITGVIVYFKRRNA